MINESVCVTCKNFRMNEESDGRDFSEGYWCELYMGNFGMEEGCFEYEYADEEDEQSDW